MEIEEFEIKFKHFNTICRFCLKKDFNLKSIIPDIINFVSVDDDTDNINNDEENLLEIIELCTGIKILPTDELPKQMCSNCLNELTESNKFRRKCVSAQEMLEEVLKCHQMQIGNINNDSNIYSSDEEFCNDDNILHDVNEIDNIKIGIDSDHISEMVFKKENEPIEEIKEENNVIILEETKKTSKPKQKNQIKKENSDEKIIQKGRKQPKTETEEETEEEKRKWKTKKGGQCQICGKIMVDLNRHIQRHMNRHKCPYCNKSWRTMNGLQRHMNSHRQHHKCEFCGFCFSDSRTLRDHRAGKHTLEATYKCDECGEKFFYAKTYRVHKKRHNKDYKPHFECETCGKVLSSKENLRKHNLIHSGEKPYECEFCGKAFARSENLKDHRRVHTKEKPYVCIHCGTAFTQKSSLNLHSKKFHLNKDI